MVMVVLFEMVPPEKYPLYSVFITALFAISLVTGPLVGGVICANASWRWVFLLKYEAYRHVRRSNAYLPTAYPRAA
jgi:predicted MFS family arabinose efflux permease